MANKTYTFDVRVTVKASDDIALKRIKDEVKQQLAGNPGANDGFAVYTADGQFEVTAARESTAYAVADTALRELESWTRSEYQGTPELANRLGQLERWRKRLGKARD